MMNISVRNKQLWMSNVVIAASLVAAAFFPTDGGFQSMISSIAFLVVLPILFIRFFLREEVSDFGVTWGNVQQGLIWLITLLVVIVTLFVWAQRYTDALLQGDVPLSVRSNFAMFLVYIFVAGILLAAQEFFLRGFALNIWKRTIGLGAIPAQAMLSMVLPIVKSRGHIGLDTLMLVVFSLYTGWMAYRSRSIWYSFFFFFISAILGILMILVFAK